MIGASFDGNKAIQENISKVNIFKPFSHW